MIQFGFSARKNVTALKTSEKCASGMSSFCLFFQPSLPYFIAFQLFKDTWGYNLFHLNKLLKMNIYKVCLPRIYKPLENLLSEIQNVLFHTEMVQPCGGNANKHPCQNHSCSFCANIWKYVHIKVSYLSLWLLRCGFGVHLCLHN